MAGDLGERDHAALPQAEVVVGRSPVQRRNTALAAPSPPCVPDSAPGGATPLPAARPTTPTPPTRGGARQATGRVSADSAGSAPPERSGVPEGRNARPTGGTPAASTGGAAHRSRSPHTWGNRACPIPYAPSPPDRQCGIPPSATRRSVASNARAPPRRGPRHLPAPCHVPCHGTSRTVAVPAGAGGRSRLSARLAQRPGQQFRGQVAGRLPGGLPQQLRLDRPTRRQVPVVREGEHRGARDA